MKRALVTAAVLLAFPAGAAAAERPVQWRLADEAIPGLAAREVKISFAVDGCGDNQDVQRVTVARNDDAVTITVFDEDPVEEVCPAIAKLVERRVDLGGRLGGRAIVDGSTGATVVGMEQLTYFGLVRKPRRDSRRVVINIASGVCNPDDSADPLFTRAVVTRRRKALVIRAYARVDPAPYGQICAGVGKDIVRTVSLRGRRGRRAILDGSFTPPRRPLLSGRSSPGP